MNALQKTQHPYPQDEILTKEEACKYLKVSQRKIDYLREEGQIPYMKFGGLVRFRRRDLDAYATRMTIGPKE